MFSKFHRWLNPRRATACVPLLVPRPAPDWDYENIKHLRTFLSNPTGQKLLLRARALEAARCIAACQGNGDVRTAAGFTDAINWVESLATLPPSSGAQDETPGDSEGEMSYPDSVLATT